jgi:hypothetical protein
VTAEHHKHPVSEDAVRTWEPHQKCRDEVMNEVLDALLELGGKRVRQMDLVSRMHHFHQDLARGTCKAYVSASLLYFREAGWVECVGAEPTGPMPFNRTPLWSVVD